MISRRLMLSLPALALPALALPGRAFAADANERSIGRDDAKVVVSEWFSLTCPHCAHFALNFLPQIKTDLIDTGRVKLIFRDFPLDRVALSAAQVAHTLPAARYLPFIDALFASQDRWAFARGVDNIAEIAKTAALAGMNRAAVDAAIANADLKAAILAGQEQASSTYKIDSTPTFVFNGPSAVNRVQAGALTPDQFAAAVVQAGG
jgi:protein-disulfide isomerase